MSCKYCELKRRKDDDVEWIAGEDWESEIDDRGGREMKLRNRKTGEVKMLWGDNCICLGFGDCNKVYDSLAELNEDWEDYKPAEPLIKDEKIRKAVRAWAEVLHIDQDNIKVSIGSHRTSIIGWQPGLIGGYSIDFPNILNELHDGMQTTITELCGEEEE